MAAWYRESLRAASRPRRAKLGRCRTPSHRVDRRRSGLQRAHRAPLAQHRAELAELAHLTQLLHGVRSGDAAAIDELARRWLRLRLARQVRCPAGCGAA